MGDALVLGEAKLDGIGAAVLAVEFDHQPMAALARIVGGVGDEMACDHAVFDLGPRQHFLVLLTIVCGDAFVVQISLSAAWATKVNDLIHEPRGRLDDRRYDGDTGCMGHEDFSWTVGIL